MASKVIVALALFTLLGLALAANDPEEAMAAPGPSGINGTTTNNEQGGKAADESTEATPTGVPVADGTVPAADGPTSLPPLGKNVASTIKLSTFVVGVAGLSLFYF
ncbi:hypothetical protein vseg_001657 [Gypsophila vaccaria]